MKTLNVHHAGVLVGKLSQTEVDELNFVYDEKWPQKTGPLAKVDINCRKEAVHVQDEKKVHR